MGHYASEMDPDWGKPSYEETVLSQIVDPDLQDFARYLNGMSEYPASEADRTVKFVTHLGAYIDRRVNEIIEQRNA